MVLGVLQITVMLTAVWVDRKTGQTILAMAASVIPSIAGTVVLMSVQRTSKALSLVTRNVAGQTKRATVIASNFVCWAAGNAVGPQVFRQQDEPRYFLAFSVQLACYCLLFILLFVLRAYYMYQNKIRDRRMGEGEVVPDVTLAHGFEDKTDKENLNFRYHY
jgi:hypothetical protein